MPDEPAASGAPRRRAVFVAVTILATIGSAVALISATGVTTAAGQMDRGALYSGIFLALGMVTGAVALPFGPSLAHRLGTRGAFLLLMWVTAAAWLVSGLLIVVGAPGMPVLLALAPVTGLAGGMSAPLTPIVFRAYLGATDVAAAVSRATFFKGIAWVVGGLAGGILLTQGLEAVGLVVAGLLKVPLAVLLTRAEPTTPLPQPVHHPSAVGAIRQSLSASATLRRAAVVGAGLALFVTPVMSLCVPIAQSLRHEPLYQGAGLLMAGFAVGETLSPNVLERFRGAGGPIRGAARAAAITGMFLVALGLVSLQFSFRTELALWVVVAVGIAACQYSARALTLGASAEALGPERAATSLAAVEMSFGLAAPVGVLAWSAALGGLGASPTAIASGVGVVLLSVLVLRATPAESTQPPPAT